MADLSGAHRDAASEPRRVDVVVRGTGRHKAALSIQRVHRGIMDRNVVERLKHVKDVQEGLLVYEQVRNSSLLPWNVT
eukprot:1086466-Rhodomonas_salina.1